MFQPLGYGNGALYALMIMDTVSASYEPVLRPAILLTFCLWGLAGILDPWALRTHDHSMP